MKAVATDQESYRYCEWTHGRSTSIDHQVGACPNVSIISNGHVGLSLRSPHL